MISKFEMKTTILELSNERPIFHSEADFQHGLAWAIHRRNPQARVRLEYNKVSLNNRTTHIDIFLADSRTAIELKYKTDLISPFNYDGETYSLKDHSAQDTGRYDFCRDLERLENMVDLGVAAHGYAIFLSNEPQYWKEGRKLAPCDQSFRLHQGRRLEGRLDWQHGTSEGTKRKRTCAVTLKRSYVLDWVSYHTFDAIRNGKFQYLMVEV